MFHCSFRVSVVVSFS